VRWSLRSRLVYIGEFLSTSLGFQLLTTRITWTSTFPYFVEQAKREKVPEKSGDTQIIDHA
jgi:hypothetical protein